MATTASYASVILGLLASYCYRFPSVLAIPDRKENIYIEEEWPLRRSYRLEDFLWSGSGDGQEDDGGRGHASTWRTTTVIRTTTVLTTVFPTPLYTTTLVQEHALHTPHIKSSSELCSSDLMPSWSETIRPTPTMLLPSPTVRPPWPPPVDTRPVSIPEKQFWLVTVLNINASLPEPSTAVLESRLARLYRIAFNRQQERHLGITNATSQQQLEQQAQMRMRRARERRVPEPVSVNVFNKTTTHPGELELLYTVHVAGKPVLAYTAAADMRLVLDNEVTAELGYPVVTKAEPYLKRPEQLGGVWKEARARDTWLLVGAAVAALLLLLILLTLVALGLGKRKRNKRRVLSGEGKREGRGEANKAFQDEERNKQEDDDDSTLKPSGSKASPSFIPVGPTAVTFKDDRSNRKHHGSSSSISSASSGASLVKRRHRHSHRTAKSKIRETESRHRQDIEEEDVKIIKDIPQPAPRKRHPPSSKPTKVSQSSPLRDPAIAMQKGDAREHDIDGFNSTEELAPRASPILAPKTRTASSPNSYLSMPSIKAFPRGANIPEPLARVLEPVSIRHLDAEGGIIVDPVRRVARHGSMEGEDPGVIGPVVWDLHCHRMQQQQHPGYLEEAEEDVILQTVEGDISQTDTAAPNVGRMRRRFHELLDDAFSLFGSRSESPGAEEESSSPPVLHRVHSAIVRPVGEPLLAPAEAIPRPSTSADPRRPATAVARPRGAWGTCNPSPHSGRSGTLPRPLSAGPFHRPQLPGPVEITIDRTLVLTDAQLLPSDPAIPLIAAIKEELRKFQGTNVHPAVSLPGSTSSKP